MTHEYVCTCGKIHQRNYGFSDVRPSRIKCECGKTAKHVIRVPAVIFRGNGFTKSNTSSDA